MRTYLQLNSFAFFAKKKNSNCVQYRYRYYKSCANFETNKTEKFTILVFVAAIKKNLLNENIHRTNYLFRRLY